MDCISTEIYSIKLKQRLHPDEFHSLLVLHDLEIFFVQMIMLTEYNCYVQPIRKPFEPAQINLGFKHVMESYSSLTKVDKTTGSSGCWKKSSSTVSGQLAYVQTRLCQLTYAHW